MRRFSRIVQLSKSDPFSLSSFSLSYDHHETTSTDPRGKIKRTYTDSHHRVSQVEEVNGGTSYFTNYVYDAADSLIKVTNALGHNTLNVYDFLGRKVAMCDPNMGTLSSLTTCTTTTPGAWVYTYNLAGDMLTQKDAKNQTLTFTYDILGRPLTKKQGTNSLVTWTYDDPAVLYSKGKVTQIVDQAITTKFAYDQLGRTTQTQRQQLGVWYTMAQQYDALSRITSETFPDNENVSYTYNEAGWLSTVPGYINGITYNARGQKTALTYANNLTTTWTFDANSFRVTNRATSSNQQNLSYGYDANGNITSITDTLFSATRTFGYDDLNRLTSATGTFGVNQANQNCTYTYNAIGNLTDKCGTAFTYGDVMHPSAVTFNPATGKNYTYDANGNMLTRGNQTLVWDIDNRVSSIAISGGGTTLMEYDYSGIRVKKNAPAGISLYPFQGYEIDPSGTKTKFIRIGIETFASKQTTSGGSSSQYFYHNDHLGSVNVITDITGMRVQLNEYDPWGGVSRTSGTIDPTHRFNGKELDPETGLYYYGGRYYDAEISRFISADPFVPSPGNPQALNRYSYTINNPVNHIDPSGYFFKKLFKGIGNFFKGIVKNPGVFFATLFVAVVTYGAASAALGASSIGASLSATGSGAIAGAAAGASAGMVGAAMTGGNIWKGMLIGGVGGAVGGAVAGHFGRSTAQGIISGAQAGGAAAGAMRTALSGGRFLQNVIGGALHNGLLASFQAVAMKGWELAMKDTIDSSAKQGPEENIKNNDGKPVVAGLRRCPTCPSSEPKFYEQLYQNAPDNRLFGIPYNINSLFGKAVNAIGGPHDWGNSFGYSSETGHYMYPGPVLDRLFDVYSLSTMPIAATYTAFAFAPAYYYQGRK